MYYNYFPGAAGFIHQLKLEVNASEELYRCHLDLPVVFQERKLSVTV